MRRNRNLPMNGMVWLGLTRLWKAIFLFDRKWSFLISNWSSCYVGWVITDRLVKMKIKKKLNNTHLMLHMWRFFHSLSETCAVSHIKRLYGTFQAWRISKTVSTLSSSPSLSFSSFFFFKWNLCFFSRWKGAVYSTNYKYLMLWFFFFVVVV